MSVQLDTTAATIDPPYPSVHRRRSSAAPLSPSAVPELTILPQPRAADKVLVGQLVSATSKHDPALLEDRDYDDVGSRWYKDVVLIDPATNKFKESLGATLYIQKPQEGVEVGTIEAREMRVRLLKDPASALKKVVQHEDTKKWVLEQAKNGEVGFVTAVREVTNASYKRAALVDRGAGNWEVVREVGGEGTDGKRRDSGLEVETGSKKDVVGVLVTKVLVQGGELKLGEEEMGSKLWNL